MFPVEPMTQPKLPPVQGEAAAVAMSWEREEGVLSPWSGGFLGPRWSAGLHYVSCSLFLGSLGLSVPSLEVSIITCWPDGKPRLVERLGSKLKSQSMDDRACVAPPVVSSASAVMQSEQPEAWGPRGLVLSREPRTKGGE